MPKITLIPSAGSILLVPSKIRTTKSLPAPNPQTLLYTSIPTRKVNFRVSLLPLSAHQENFPLGETEASGCSTFSIWARRGKMS